MSFDEAQAKAFLSGEDFDSEAATAFLMGAPETTPTEGDTGEEFMEHLTTSKPQGYEPKPKYSGVTGAIFGNDVPAPIKIGGEFANAANSKFLDLLGMPADALNWALDLTGLDPKYRSSGTSEDFRSIGQSAGVAYKETPDTATARAGEYTALGLEFLAAPLMLFREGSLHALNMGKTVMPETGVVRGIGQTVVAPFATSGKTALATEVSASAASGVGAYYGQQEFGQTGEMIGGLVGGLTAVPVAMVSPYVSRYIQKSILTNSKAGGQIKASERIHQLAETGDISATITREQGNILENSVISPAKLSGDRHLIALENEILKTDPALSHKFILQDFENNKLAIEELKMLGGDVPVTKTQANIRAKVNHVTELVNAKIDQSLAKAANSLRDIAPSVQRRAVNTAVKENLDDALSKARAVEGEWWGKVKQDVVVPTAETKTVFSKELASRAQAADPEDIPPFLYTFLGSIEKGQFKPGKWGADQTVKEMQALRSRALNEIRNEKAKEAPNWNKVRILDDVQEGILADLAAAKQHTGVEEAIAFSRELNQKFKGGIMDVIFGNKKTGGKVAPELTVSSIKSGPKAAVEINKIITASPESKPLMEELIKLNIVQSKAINTTTGRVNVPQAKRYMLENEDVFELFPDLRKNMDAAIGLEERAIGTKASAKTRLDKINRSAAAKIANAKPQRVWTEIITSENPKITMRKAMERSNDIGKRGIKNDAVDYLMGKSKTGKFDDDGVSILSGKKFKNELDSNRGLYKEAFNEKEMARLEQISQTLVKTEGFANLPDVGGVISPQQGMLAFGIVTLATRAGATLGHGTSGASLRTASMTSKLAQSLIDKLDVGQAQKILKDAIQDPELFKAIYSDVTKPPEWAQAYKILQGWMIAHAVESLETNQ